MMGMLQDIHREFTPIPKTVMIGAQKNHVVYGIQPTMFNCFDVTTIKRVFMPTTNTTLGIIIQYLYHTTNSVGLHFNNWIHNTRIANPYICTFLGTKFPCHGFLGRAFKNIATLLALNFLGNFITPSRFGAITRTVRQFRQLTWLISRYCFSTIQTGLCRLGIAIINKTSHRTINSSLGGCGFYNFTAMSTHYFDSLWSTVIFLVAITRTKFTYFADRIFNYFPARGTGMSNSSISVAGLSLQRPCIAGMRTKFTPVNMVISIRNFITTAMALINDPHFFLLSTSYHKVWCTARQM